MTDYQERVAIEIAHDPSARAISDASDIEDREIRIAGYCRDVRLMNRPEPKLKPEPKRCFGKPCRRLTDGAVFPSRTAAASAHGVTGAAIRQAIRNGTKSGGYHWELA